MGANGAGVLLTLGYRDKRTDSGMWQETR